MEKIRMPIGTNNWNAETYRNNLENIFWTHKNANIDKYSNVQIIIG